jgi:hypothetical protein
MEQQSFVKLQKAAIVSYLELQLLHHQDLTD